MQDIKGIFNEKINEKDIYEAVIAAADVDREVIPKGRKGGRRTVRKAVTAVCAAAAVFGVVILGAGSLNEDKLKTQEYDNGIIVNEVNDEAAAMRLDVDIVTAEGDKTTTFEAVQGLKVPKDMTEVSYFNVYGRDGDTGEYTRLAWYRLVYGDGQDKKSVTVNFSDKGKPSRCYLFPEGRLSDIGGTELMLYHYGDSYMADFKHEGLWYDIETVGISEGEMTELIESLIG